METIDYLLDTHTLIWWWTKPDALSKYAHELISDPYNNIHISAASVWEMATKHRKGKLGSIGEALADFQNMINTDSFYLLNISCQHAMVAGQYSSTHRDPFDRMLCAQAQTEQIGLISCDSKLSGFPIHLVW